VDAVCVLFSVIISVSDVWLRQNRGSFNNGQSTWFLRN